MNSPSETVRVALDYARLGWPVLPLTWPEGSECSCPRNATTRGKDGACHSPGKHPLTPHGLHDASTDETVIREWWRRWPKANIGIATGTASGLLALDIDPRNGGEDTFGALVNQLGALPETPAVETGGGGMHYYFVKPEGVLGAKLGPGIDIKCDGGYVVAPPSQHVSGGAYVWRAECSPDEVALAQLPAPWLAALLRSERADASAETMPECDIPIEVRQHRAGAYVARMPPAISGQGGHDKLWNVACVVVRGFMVAPEHAMSIARDYSARCVPPWNERDLQHKLEDAGRRSVLNWGYLLLPQQDAGDGAQPRDDWPEPVPLDRSHAGTKMPLDALSPWLRDIVAAIARAYQVPPEFPALYALAIVSGTLAGKFEARVRDGWVMPLVLYVLCALAPSERKSPAIAALTRALREWENDENTRNADARNVALSALRRAEAREKAALKATERSGEAKPGEPTPDQRHAAASRELDRARAAVPPLTRALVEYATPEALVERMAANGGRQIIVSDEGAGVLQGPSRYSKGAADLDVLLKGYDGAPYTPARITREASVLPAALLSVAIGLQPSALVEALKDHPEIRERGLLARFLAVLPLGMLGRRAVRQAPVPEATQRAYDTNLRALLDIADKRDDKGRLAPRTLRFSSGADDAICELEVELEPEFLPGGKFERVASWVGKLAGNAARLAAVLHVADYAGGVIPDLIPEETARRAVRIAKACIPHAFALEEAIAAPPELKGARRIAEWLLAKELACVTDRDILRALRGTVVLSTKKQRDAAMALLSEHGLARRAPSAGTTKPTPGWFVNLDGLRKLKTPDHMDNMDNSPSGEGSVHESHADSGFENRDEGPTPHEPASNIPNPAPPPPTVPPGTPPSVDISAMTRSWPFDRQVRWSTLSARFEQQGLSASEASRLAYERISAEARV